MNNFQQLITSIDQIHNHQQARVVNAVNQALTIRNWLIGYYIVEFEQNGEDRGEYGEKLIPALAEQLSGLKGINQRSLFRFRNFYLLYSNLAQYVIDANWVKSLKFNTVKYMGTLSPQSGNELLVPSEKIVSKLSYSHLELLMNVDDPLKCTFYEIEWIKGTWSVRELKRQIASLYYECSGLSAKHEKLTELVHQKSQPQ